MNCILLELYIQYFPMIIENEGEIIVVETNRNHFHCQLHPTLHNEGAGMKDHYRVWIYK